MLLFQLELFVPRVLVVRQSFALRSPMLWPELTLQRLLVHQLMPALELEPELQLEPMLQLGLVPLLELMLMLGPELRLRPLLLLEPWLYSVMRLASLPWPSWWLQQCFEQV